MAELRQLTKLLHPFPSAAVKENPSGGGSYVAHPVVEQRLLDVLGGPPDTTVAHIVRGWVAPIEANPNANSKRAKEGRPVLESAVVGVVLRMTATVDGRTCTVEEAGDCEDPHNWSTDGQRLKDAMSDAYKRAAMRFGVALHLWAGDQFYLGAKLLKQDQGDDRAPSESLADDRNAAADAYLEAHPNERPF